MKKIISSFLVLLTVSLSLKIASQSMDHDHQTMAHDSMHHSVSTIPLSIMEAGTHKAGHFMISLRHMRMSMDDNSDCLLYTSPSPRDRQKSRMPSSA